MARALAALSHDRRIAEALLEISYAVGSVMEIDDILQRIAEIAARVMETDTCSVYLRGEDNPQWLELVATKGLSRAEELGVRGFHWGEGVPGWAAVHNQTVALDNVKNDSRYARLDDTPDETRFLAYLVTPLRIQDEVVGIITFRRAHVGPWAEEEIVFAEFIAKQVAIVLEKARLYRQKVDAERLAAVAVSLSEVAHYIKNVLQNLMGGAYLVEQGLQKDDVTKIRTGWGLLSRSTTKIHNLVENMLLYSRQQRCELNKADVNEILRNMGEEVQAQAENRGVEVTVSLRDDLPMVELDESAFHDAILNLVSNAIDAIPNGQAGVVEVRTDLAEDGRHVRILVRDNGTGIPEDVQKRMFNLFFSTKGKGGTGIGLAATRRIIDEHHGRLAFESVADEGTTFVVELPAAG